MNEVWEEDGKSLTCNKNQGKYRVLTKGELESNFVKVHDFACSLNLC